METHWTVLLPVRKGNFWRVQIVWPNGAVHHFGKFASSVDWRGCVRRTINLICPLALLVVGAYWFVDLPLYAFHPEGIIVVAVGAAAATFLGLYLLIRGRGNKAAH